MDQPWGNLPGVNYDAGRPAATLVLWLDKHAGPNVGHMPHFPMLPGLANGHLIAVLAMNYAFRAERHFQLATKLHQLVFSDTPFAIEQLKEELELMIYSMRKSIDHIIQGTCLKVDTDRVLATGKLRPDSLGQALYHQSRQDPACASTLEVLFGPNRDADTTRFLVTLNTVSNAYKHGFFLPEAYMFVSRDSPNILIFDKVDNDLRNPPVVHNRHAGHVMMGFQDTINRLLVALGSKPIL